MNWNTPWLGKIIPFNNLIFHPHKRTRLAHTGMHDKTHYSASKIDNSSPCCCKIHCINHNAFSFLFAGPKWCKEIRTGTLRVCLYIGSSSPIIEHITLYFPHPWLNQQLDRVPSSCSHVTSRTYRMKLLLVMRIVAHIDYINPLPEPIICPGLANLDFTHQDPPPSLPSVSVPFSQLI